MAEGTIQQAQDTSERLRKLYELALTVAGDPVAVFDQIVKIIAELFGIRVALVEKIEGDKIITLSMYLDGKILHEGVFDLAGTPCANVHMSQSFCSFDAASHRFPQDQFLQDYNIESYIGMPVVSTSGEVIAVINAMDSQPISLTDEDVLFLKAMASRVRLELERVEQASQVEAVQAMLAIAREISSLRNLEETLHLVVERTKELLGVDLVAVATADDTAGSTSWKAVAGAKTSALQSTIFSPGRGTAGRAIAARRTVILEGIGINPDLPEEEFPIHVSEGVRNAVGIPLLVGERIAGVLILGYRSEKTLTMDDIGIAEAIAAQAAIAVENSRLFTELEAANQQLRELDRLKTRTIAELSTPVIPIWEGVLLAPIIGTLDRERAEQITGAILRAAADARARVVILDITGVRTLDTHAAQHLINTVEAVRVLGSSCIVTGIRASVAQTIVHLGIRLEGVSTRRKLSDGLHLALKIISSRDEAVAMRQMKNKDGSAEQ